MNLDNIAKIHSAVEKKIETEFDWYTAQVEQKAKMVFQTIIKPFCRERKWRFLTGMGTWAFFPPNHAAVAATSDWTDKDDPVMDAICDLLSIEVPGTGGDLGELMPECKDYTEVEEP